jgi:hypothetical protein
MNELIGTNIVLIANKHNPSIISKDWVKEKEIIEGDVINFAHLPVASIVEDLDYNLFVDEDTLRLTVKNLDSASIIDNSPNIIQKYVNKLPEIPYKALGFNFLFKIQENPEKLKEIFIADDGKSKEIFSPDYTFGGVFKFKFNEFLVTLSIMPENDEIKADFNFHFPSTSSQSILLVLEKHSAVFNKAEDVLNNIFE